MPPPARGEQRADPVLAYAETDDRIRGLLAGGDDFIAKPYSLMELELRLRLHIRRAENQAGSKDMLRFGTLTIDSALREVRNEGESHPLHGAGI